VHSPWKVLVQPAIAWRELNENASLAPIIFFQVLLALIGALLAARPFAMIAEEFGLGHLAGAGGLVAVGALILSSTVAALALDLLWAGLLFISTVLLGLRISPRSAFNLAAYALLPVFLGMTLGQLALAISRYLPEERKEALALRLRPFPMSIASLPSSGIESLSFLWFFTAYLDLFVLWTLLLIWFGLHHFLRLPARICWWIVGALMLLLALGLTGLWKGVQTMLAS
jgi:hypothetical protein